MTFSINKSDIVTCVSKSLKEDTLNQFEKRSIYWLALKQAKKAASVDASVRKLANKTAASYEGRAPSKTDIFSEAMGGKTISFSCWIGKSVTVPSLN